MAGSAASRNLAGTGPSATAASETLPMTSPTSVTSAFSPRTGATESLVFARRSSGHLPERRARPLREPVASGIFRSRRRISTSLAFMEASSLSSSLTTGEAPASLRLVASNSETSSEKGRLTSGSSVRSGFEKRSANILLSSVASNVITGFRASNLALISAARRSATFLSSSALSSAVFSEPGSATASERMRRGLTESASPIQEAEAPK